MFDKIKGRIREWRKNHPAVSDSKPQLFTPKVHPWEQLEKPATREIVTSARARWITFGLNRKERRTIDARIRKGVAVRFDKWQMANTPRNWPSNGGSNNPVFEGRI